MVLKHEIPQKNKNKEEEKIYIFIGIEFQEVSVIVGNFHDA